MKLEIQMRMGHYETSTQQLMLQAAEWFAKTMLTPAEVAELGPVKIALRQSHALQGDMGYCIPTKWVGTKYKGFKIAIDRTLSEYWKVRVLAHEFVHLRQFVRRELYYQWVDEALVCFWKGVNVQGLTYAQSPQEIEANAEEVGLADRFFAARQVKTYEFSTHRVFGQ